MYLPYIEYVTLLSEESPMGEKWGMTWPYSVSLRKEAFDHILHNNRGLTVHFRLSVMAIIFKGPKIQVQHRYKYLNIKRENENLILTQKTHT